MHGLTGTAANIRSVTKGFFKTTGNPAGYRATPQGKTGFVIGFSHPVEVQPPEDHITIDQEKEYFDHCAPISRWLEKWPQKCSWRKPEPIKAKVYDM